MSKKIDRPETINEIEITTKVLVTDEDLKDIVETAFYAGISYWCNDADVPGDRLGTTLASHLVAGGELNLYDQESDDIWTLTKDKLLAGIKKYIEGGNSEVLNEGGLDTGEIDSEAADCIVQYALFGELVFG